MRGGQILRQIVPIYRVSSSRLDVIVDAEQSGFRILLSLDRYPGYIGAGSSGGLPELTKGQKG